MSSKFQRTFQGRTNLINSYSLIGPTFTILQLPFWQPWQIRAYLFMLQEIRICGAAKKISRTCGVHLFRFQWWKDHEHPKSQGGTLLVSPYKVKNEHNEHDLDAAPGIHFLPVRLGHWYSSLQKIHWNLSHMCIIYKHQSTFKPLKPIQFFWAITHNILHSERTSLCGIDI